MNIESFPASMLKEVFVVLFLEPNRMSKAKPNISV